MAAFAAKMFLFTRPLPTPIHNPLQPNTTNSSPHHSHENFTLKLSSFYSSTRPHPSTFLTSPPFRNRHISPAEHDFHKASLPSCDVGTTTNLPQRPQQLSHAETSSERTASEIPLFVFPKPPLPPPTSPSCETTKSWQGRAGQGWLCLSPPLLCRRVAECCGGPVLLKGPHCHLHSTAP